MIASMEILGYKGFEVFKPLRPLDEFDLVSPGASEAGRPGFKCEPRHLGAVRQQASFMGLSLPNSRCGSYSLLHRVPARTE